MKPFRCRTALVWAATLGTLWSAAPVQAAASQVLVELLVSEFKLAGPSFGDAATLYKYAKLAAEEDTDIAVTHMMDDALNSVSPSQLAYNFIGEVMGLSGPLGVLMSANSVVESGTRYFLDWSKNRKFETFMRVVIAPAKDVNHLRALRDDFWDNWPAYTIGVLPTERPELEVEFEKAFFEEIKLLQARQAQKEERRQLRQEAHNRIERMLALAERRLREAREMLSGAGMPASDDNLRKHLKDKGFAAMVEQAFNERQKSEKSIKPAASTHADFSPFLTRSRQTISDFKSRKISFKAYQSAYDGGSGDYSGEVRKKIYALEDKDAQAALIMQLVEAQRQFSIAHEQAARELRDSAVAAWTNLDAIAAREEAPRQGLLKVVAEERRELEAEDSADWLERGNVAAAVARAGRTYVSEGPAGPRASLADIRTAVDLVRAAQTTLRRRSELVASAGKRIDAAASEFEDTLSKIRSEYDRAAELDAELLSLGYGKRRDFKVGKNALETAHAATLHGFASGDELTRLARLESAGIRLTRAVRELAEANEKALAEISKLYEAERPFYSFSLNGGNVKISVESVRKFFETELKPHWEPLGFYRIWWGNASVPLAKRLSEDDMAKSIEKERADLLQRYKGTVADYKERLEAAESALRRAVEIVEKPFAAMKATDSRLSQIKQPLSFIALEVLDAAKPPVQREMLITALQSAPWLNQRLPTSVSTGDEATLDMLLTDCRRRLPELEEAEKRCIALYHDNLRKEAAVAGCNGMPLRYPADIEKRWAEKAEEARLKSEISAREEAETAKLPKDSTGEVVRNIPFESVVAYLKAQQGRPPEPLRPQSSRPPRQDAANKTLSDALEPLLGEINGLRQSVLRGGTIASGQTGRLRRRLKQADLNRGTPDAYNRDLYYLVGAGIDDIDMITGHENPRLKSLTVAGHRWEDMDAPLVLSPEELLGGKVMIEGVVGGGFTARHLRDRPGMIMETSKPEDFAEVVEDPTRLEISADGGATWRLVDWTSASPWRFEISASPGTDLILKIQAHDPRTRLTMAPDYYGAVRVRIESASVSQRVASRLSELAAAFGESNVASFMRKVSPDYRGGDDALRDKTAALLRSLQQAKLVLAAGSPELTAQKVQAPVSWELDTVSRQGVRDSRRGSSIFVFDRAGMQVLDIRGDSFLEPAGGARQDSVSVTRATLPNEFKTGPNGGCFRFEERQPASLSNGDFFWNGDMDHATLYPANGSKMMRFGGGELDEITTTPEEGYGENGIPLAEGRTYAFVTKDGKYAVIHVERLNESAMIFTYKYQPRGGNRF